MERTDRAPARPLAVRFGAPVDLVSSGGWTRPLLEGQRCVGENRSSARGARPMS
jgi:hypothetical protein